ncbi:hypothetical protein SDC9_124703 [bioreactor metagenome]|uniref:Uncharacterized protein n=1 Tax=bioreactor metagenome TaxID=1076179 RepID=A0A645CL83_9ZZZZ
MHSPLVDVGQLQRRRPEHEHAVPGAREIAERGQRFSQSQDGAFVQPRFRRQLRQRQRRLVQTERRQQRQRTVDGRNAGIRQQGRIERLRGRHGAPFNRSVKQNDCVNFRTCLYFSQPST